MRVISDPVPAWWRGGEVAESAGGVLRPAEVIRGHLGQVVDQLQ